MTPLLFLKLAFSHLVFRPCEVHPQLHYLAMLADVFGELVEFLLGGLAEGSEKILIPWMYQSCTGCSMPHAIVLTGTSSGNHDMLAAADDGRIEIAKGPLNPSRVWEEDFVLFVNWADLAEVHKELGNGLVHVAGGEVDKDLGRTVSTRG